MPPWLHHRHLLLGADGDRVPAVPRPAAVADLGAGVAVVDRGSWELPLFAPGHLEVEGERRD